MKTLAVIPARGGSKGLPRKNIKNFLGHPLIAWTISSALNSKKITDVIVSTDCDEIRKISLRYGAKVPFLRPKNLAKDSSKTEDAIIHLLDHIDEKYDIIILLEPTSPLRKINDIDSSISILNTRWDEIDAVTTLGKIQLENPQISKRITLDHKVESFIKENKKEIYQRQMYEDSYFPYGVAYVSKTSSLIKKETFYPERLGFHKIEYWQNYEIDNDLDFKICELVALENIDKMKKPDTENSRFKNWKKPEITDGKLTKWNWMVQGSENISLGVNVDIGAFTYINAKNGVFIGNNVQIGSHCSIYSESSIDRKSGSIRIGQNSCIGSHTTVMPGISIGKNVIIGAHSFVNKNIPDNTVALGVPIRIRNKND